MNLYTYFSPAKIKPIALKARALNHLFRQRIVDLLYLNPGLTVTEIFVYLRVEQAVASQHLAILRNAGFVSTQRDGKFVRYFCESENIINFITSKTEK